MVGPLRMSVSNSIVSPSLSNVPFGGSNNVTAAAVHSASGESSNATTRSWPFRFTLVGDGLSGE